MSARFFVAVEPLTKEQERQFKDYVEDNNGTWWHWISNFWLVRFTDDLGALTSNQLWGFLIKLNPKLRIIISEVKGTDWTVTDMRNSKNKSMSDWLERHWMDD